MLDADILIDKLGKDLIEILARSHIDAPLMIGIRTGGAWVAQRLHQQLGLKDPLGELNIHFHRDDFHRIGLHPHVEPSKLPVAVENRHVILVDDVLYTGRTIRAALNEIFDYGRPASIKLAVLIDRNERELPIAADAVAETLTPPEGQNIKLQGPDPLEVKII